MTDLQHLAIRLPFHQQAADQVGGNLLGVADGEGERIRIYYKQEAQNCKSK